MSGNRSDIELVIWVDSASINGGLWTDPDLINSECLTESGLTSETVGFVHGESPDAILLVQSWNTDRVGAALAIPKKAILERRKLASCAEVRARFIPGVMA